jgi:ribosomal protein L13
LEITALAMQDPIEMAVQEMLPKKELGIATRLRLSPVAFHARREAV